MEYLILGLLILSPMTGYEIQQFIKQNLSLICSHSAGSVQTALGKLYRDGLVTAEERREGKRRKKIYTITEAGQKVFSDWVAQPMRTDRVKNMELSHLFFLGLAQPEDRISAIRNYIGQMQETEAILYHIQEQFRQLKQESLPPQQDWNSILRFQAYTIAYGIAAARFEQEWYRHLLDELEGKS